FAQTLAEAHGHVRLEIAEARVLRRTDERIRIGDVGAERTHHGIAHSLREDHVETSHVGAWSGQGALASSVCFHEEMRVNRQAARRIPCLPVKEPAATLGCRTMEGEPHTLEQLLLEQGRVSQEDLRKVKRLQQERGERLDRLLLDLGFISEEALQPLLARFLGVQAISRKEFPSEAPPIGKLSYKYLRRSKVMPLAQSNGCL